MAWQDYVEITAPGSGYTSAPDAIAVGGYTIGAATIGNPTKAHLRWTAPTDLDLVRVDIYRGPDSDSANATKVAEARAGIQAAAVKLTVAVGLTEYFFLKAVDDSGNQSDFTAGVAVTRT